MDGGSQTGGLAVGLLPCGPHTHIHIALIVPTDAPGRG